MPKNLEDKNEADCTLHRKCLFSESAQVDLSRTVTGTSALLRTDGLWTSMSCDMFLQMDGVKSIDESYKNNFVSPS